MKRVMNGIIVAASGLTFSLAVHAADTAAAGKIEFRNSCALCHGMDGKGRTGVSDLLKKAPPDITQLSKKNGGVFPAERVAAMIDGREMIKVHGERDMPAWGDRYSSDKVKAAEYYGDMPYKDTEMFVKNRINALMGFIKAMQVK